MPDFQHYVSVAVKPLPYRFRKNRVRTGRSCRCCWGLCAVIARQAQDTGPEFPEQKSGRSSRLVAWRRNGRYGKIELDPI